MIDPYKFPEVEIPLGNATIEQRTEVKRLLAEYRQWAGVKARYAVALIQTGQRPSGRPSGAVKSRRRAANKRARAQRRINRLRAA